MPLEFNGHDDSIYHPFDASGNRHMEYVNQRGAFDDMPLGQIVTDFERVDPRWISQGKGDTKTTSMTDGDFLSDVERELK